MRHAFRRFWEHGVLNPIVIAIVALVVLLWSVALLSDGHEASSLLERVRALPAADAGSLRDAAGQEVLVEGQVSPRAIGGTGGLAAYVVVERRSRRSNLERERSTPPLELETAAGPLRLANSDYELPFPYRSVALGQRGPNGGQLWAYGVAPGDTVILIGRVAEVNGQPALAAEQVVLGSAGAYRAYLERRQRNGAYLGTPLLLVALALLLVLARLIAGYVRHDRALAQKLQQELAQQRLQREMRGRDRKARRRHLAAAPAAEDSTGRLRRRKP